MSDVTAAGIETVLSKFDSNPEYSYIVIPDLINVLSRGGKNKRFISFLNVALEEGIKQILRKDIEWRTRNGGAHVGVITATTTDEYFTNLRLLSGTGFVSRAFIVNFDPDTTEIAKLIAKGHKEPGIEIQVPKDLQEVTISQEAAQEITDIGTSWAKEEGEKPLRKIYLLRRFVRARALLRCCEEKKTPEVIKEDVHYVWKLLSGVRYAKRRPEYKGYQKWGRSSYSKWSSKVGS